MEKITTSVNINAPVEKVWDAYTNPEAIKQWNAASDDWHTTKATNDLRVGGTFLSRMEAKDKSAGFDFTGEYTDIVECKKIAYTMSDKREVETTFTEQGDGVEVTTVFDPESENTPEMQKEGWQAILSNFKKYVERGV